MTPLPEVHDGLPNFCGAEDAVAEALARTADAPVFLPDSGIAFDRIRAGCAVALHMHQPLTPAGGDELATAALIGNLQAMEANPGVGDNHNAPVFRRCYARMGDFIPQLVAEGKAPRVMLEYSGTLLYGLQLMGAHDVLDRLRGITCDPQQRRAVEWLGAPWGHAVAPSTPVQDFRLHVRAWQHHFAALFGLEALARVAADVATDAPLDERRAAVMGGLVSGALTGLGADLAAGGLTFGAGMLAGALVGALGGAGVARGVNVVRGKSATTVRWQEPFLERQLTLALLRYLAVAHFGRGRGEFAAGEIPAHWRERAEQRVADAALPEVQPLFQQRIWARMHPGDGAGRLATVIAELRAEDGRFHMDGGSWTNNLSWVRGYDNVLGPMEEASALFHEVVLRPRRPTGETRYRNALLHLLSSQTSCYRYWGQGQWTDYGRELCRRTGEILRHDF